MQDSCHLKKLDSRRSRLKFRECVRQEKWLYDLLAGNPEVLALVAQLLGEGRVATPKFVRGLYQVFPSDAKGQKTVAGHWDLHLFQVGTVLCLDRVDADGGLAVWPGSHQPLGLACRSRHGDDPMEAHASQVETVSQKIVPVELTGPAGTLLLGISACFTRLGLTRAVACATRSQGTSPARICRRFRISRIMASCGRMEI